MSSTSPNPDYQLPADEHLERVLLAAVMIDNAYWDQVSQLPADAWTLDSHRRIRMAMKRLHDKGIAIDQITVAEYLKARNELAACGGVSYITDLDQGVPRRPAVEDYIRMVRNTMILRRTILICSSATAQAAERGVAGLEIVGGLQKQLETLSDSSPLAREPEIEKFLIQSLDKANERYKSKVAPRIPTGNAWIDAKIGGILHGYYTIIAARPKIGKSGFGDTAIAYNCQRGTKVVKISLEVDRDTSLYNLVPHVVDLPNIVCVRQELQTPEQNTLFNQGMAHILEHWKLKIYEGDIDCDETCWIIDRETKGADEDVLFVLDHFGLMVEAGKSSPGKIRESYVTDSGRLRRKLYGKRAAMLALFQLNEVPREYADKLPRPADIGESKKPLQDCAACILLHRYQDKETLKMTKKANVNLALVRNGGAPGNVDCEFDTRKLAFIAQPEIEYPDYYGD
jgi:replicative DNA helicase